MIKILFSTKVLLIQKTKVLKYIIILLLTFTSLSIIAQDQDNEIKKTIVLEDNNITIIQDTNAEIIALQISGILKRKLMITVYDNNGKLLETKMLRKGSTICHINTQTYYNGTYTLKISNGKQSVSENMTINKEF